MFSFFTLLSIFLSYIGISNIYKGKKEENKKEITKGIFLSIISVVGIAFFNPIFNSFILSLFSGIVFILCSLGFISYTFLNTHPETLFCTAEILDKESTPNNIKEIKKNEDITINNQSLPIVTNYIKNKFDLIHIKNNK